MELIIDKLLTFSSSFLEALTINFFFGVISQYEILKKGKLILFSAILALSGVITGYFAIPYHFAISIIVIIIVFHFISGYKFIDSSIDLLFAIVLLAITQIVITLIVTMFYDDALSNMYLIIIIMLILVSLIAILYYKTSFLKRWCMNYYQPNKNIIFIVVVNILFLATIITKIYYYNSEIVDEPAIDITLIFIGYVVANILILIISFVYFNEKQRSKIVADYGKNLESVVNELKSMTHEHNAHLQMLITMLEDESKSSENRNTDAVEYLNILTNEIHGSRGSSFVKDNLLISAVLHHASTLAKQLEIKFTITVESTLSNYNISDNDLVDVLLNLVNNAFEEVCNMPKEDRVVEVVFSKKSIEVINRISKATSARDTSTFLDKGFSTKGLGRGFGITNVLGILEKYDYTLDNEILNKLYISRINIS